MFYTIHFGERTLAEVAFDFVGISKGLSPPEVTPTPHLFSPGLPKCHLQARLIHCGEKSLYRWIRSLSRRFGRH